jgi:hypothetical protein
LYRAVKLAAPSAAAGTKRVWNAVCVSRVDPVGGGAGKAGGCTRVRSDASVRGRRLAVKSAPLHTAGGGGELPVWHSGDPVLHMVEARRCIAAATIVLSAINVSCAGQ